MKKQLRKPENWQDFESLCKVLWGEIWSCPEIKKNGRTGQKQHGVDVYGTPQGETEYYGIQCKGKDEYSSSELTPDEVDLEVKKANEFKPKLKKFYFATTANKNAKIEEYVRLKDEISRKNGDFEIHLFSWEDIVDLIEENRHTHNWYVTNIGFKLKHSVHISFDTGETHLEFFPKLLKNYVEYRQRDKSKITRSGTYTISSEYNASSRLEKIYDPQPKRCYVDGQTFNLSSCVFSLQILNDGNVPIENFKMYISLPAENIIVDTVNKQNIFLDSIKYKYNTVMYQNTNNCVFEPNEQILVQTDRIITDKICLRPTLEAVQDITINYEFVAKDFNKVGQLTIRLNTQIKEKHSVEYIEIIKPNETRLENCFK